MDALTAVSAIDSKLVPPEMLEAAQACWTDALEMGKGNGFRNAQTTVIAPTGTIGFMMDCDTTGIEPDIALVKYKRLVGGGMIKIVNGTVPAALKRLGYDKAEVKDIVEYIDEFETIEGAPELKPEHLTLLRAAVAGDDGFSGSLQWLQAGCNRYSWPGQCSK